MRADVLKIAVSSQNSKTVTDHAGRCRKFWVYEIRGNKVGSKTLRELTLEQTLHSSRLADGHPLDDVHVMITAGMSPFLYQRLQQGGIRPFVTEEPDPDKAVRMLLERVAQV
jgi:predicted Fe-Mo cluster-binding NifX family protein